MESLSYLHLVSAKERLYQEVCRYFLTVKCGTSAAALDCPVGKLAGVRQLSRAASYADTCVPALSLVGPPLSQEENSRPDQTLQSLHTAVASVLDMRDNSDLSRRFHYCN